MVVVEEDDRKEELLVEVSQKREVQRSRRGRAARAAPGRGGDQAQSFGWLGWHKQSSNKKIQ